MDEAPFNYRQFMHRKREFMHGQRVFIGSLIPVIMIANFLKARPTKNC